jgi:hypothetical protein
MGHHTCRSIIVKIDGQSVSIEEEEYGGEGYGRHVLREVTGNMEERDRGDMG